MGSPAVYYLCFGHNAPSGGNRQIYRHVDILNRHGLDAAVVHGEEGFRLTWFENDTRVVDLGRFHAAFDPARDWVVVPEDLGPAIDAFPGRKVIFDQSLHYGFQVLGRERPAPYPCLRPDVRAVLTVSPEVRDLLSFVYPRAEILAVINGIDVDRAARPLRDRRRAVAFNATKNPIEVATAHHVAMARAAQGLNALGDFTWTFLEGVTEAEVARALDESLIFVTLSLHEALPLMPLEAVASGCLVVAYGIAAVAGYLPEAYRVPPLDLRALVERIEAMAASFPDDLGRWEAARAAGLAAAREHTLGRQEKSVLGAWARILDRTGP
jgi:glycosyltransferase involved in cell wall biosynthesis